MGMTAPVPTTLLGRLGDPATDAARARGGAMATSLVHRFLATAETLPE